MALDRRYEQGFLKQLDSALKGDVVYLPNALDRVDETYNLMQSRYHLIGGATGSGKTSFVDFSYVLYPYTYVIKNIPDLHCEWVYFSLERKRMFKHAKFLSWFLYRDHKLQVSADDLMGWGKLKITPDWYKSIRSYDNEMADLLSLCDIYDGKFEIDSMKKIVEARARALGDYFRTDDIGVYKNDSPVPIKRFDQENLKENTKTGTKDYIVFNYKGEEQRLYKNDHVYFPFKPKTFVFIIVDGIGLAGGTNFSENKSKIDNLSVYLASARDLYGFSPVVVSQLNRALGDSTRQKIHGADLSPQLEDFQGSSQMSHDADLVAALFDPYRYKAFDKKTGTYAGYQIKEGEAFSGSMMSPSGFNRFRSYHILKNTFGMDGIQYGLKFMGESNHFSTLPKADDPVGLQEVYAEIAQGK